MKALAAFLVSKSRMIIDDKNSYNPVAIQELKKVENEMPKSNIDPELLLKESSQSLDS
jgi:hypothetical protein